MSKRAAKLIGDQLHTLRVSRGLSVIAVAKVLRVKRQMVYQYEKGHSLPALDVLKRAATAWSVTFDLEGCKVIPQQVGQEKAAARQPVQEAFAFRRPRLYKKASIRIRQRDHEMIITAVVHTKP